MARSPSDPYYTESIDIRPKQKVEDKWDWMEFLGGIVEGAPKGLAMGISLKELGDKESARRLAELRKDPDFYLDKYDKYSAQRKEALNPLVDNTIPSSYIPGRDFAGLDMTEDLASGGIPERVTPEQMGIDLRAVKETRDRELGRRRLVQSPEAEKFMKNMTEGDALILRAERESGERKLVANEIKSASIEYALANGTLVRLGRERADLNARAKAAYDAGDVDTAAQLKQQAEAITKAGIDWSIKLGQARQKLEEHGIPKEEFDAVLTPGKRDEAIETLMRKWAKTGRSRTPGSK